jgi:hemolysin activation/secretion protein
MLKRSNGVTSLMGLGLMLPVLAQAALSPSAQPDAGRLSRELKPQVDLPQPGITMTLPTPGREVVQSGGLRIILNKVAFAGNTVFSQQQLTEVLQSSLGKQYDLAGLFQLADQISAYYRERGYSFAKAFVPEDGFRDGVLIMQVVEGNYGERKALADSPRRSAQAQRFLEPLRAGDPIHTPTLEKRLLILDSLPGYSVLPVIKPGAEMGSGDLDVRLTRTALATGSVGLSNHGNRYTGYYQARANVSLNSPFMFGDQLAFSLLSSDQSLQSSSVNYSMPLGGNGMRATAGYSLTDYRLGISKASGRAQTTTLVAQLQLREQAFVTRALTRGIGTNAVRATQRKAF